MTSTQRTPTQRRRQYRSPRRAEHAAQNRAAILEAATRLFAARGWAGTNMRDIAREAGVAVETVYSNFGSKPEVLLAAIDIAVVGDNRPVALADRPEFAALGKGSLRQRARAAARLVRTINERTAGLGLALREGAGRNGDVELSRRVAEAEERRRTNVTEAIELMTSRPVDDTDRDGVWALVSMEVYQLLIERAGWSAARYEGWLEEALTRLLRARGREKS